METKLKFYLCDTKLGWVGMAIASGPQGVRLRATTLPRRSRDDALHEIVETGAVEPATEAGAGDLPRLLQAYVEGQRVDLIPYVDWDGLSDNGLRMTGFRRAVIDETLRIPAGETRTYAWIAAKVGRPGAARAVGRVMATNPLPLVIPCHRVVGSDGTLRGYGGGLPMKAALLRQEAAP